MREGITAALGHFDLSIQTHFFYDSQNKKIN